MTLNKRIEKTMPNRTVKPEENPKKAMNSLEENKFIAEMK
jgi:hypothetical protein